MITEKLLELGLVPDLVIRKKIRSLLRERLEEVKKMDQQALIQAMEASPVAVEVQAANEQHYELPPEFFEKVLGSHMKYSCGLFSSPKDSLSSAEEQMLRLTSERADLKNGQDVLELGCGWGSLTIWMAKNFPDSKIFAVSNSSAQRKKIEERAKKSGLKNIEVLTQDMNHFHTERKFDRVVSVEMFEHMRNVPLLFSRVNRWLKEEGRLFIHIFSHREWAYFFEDQGPSDWLARHFFTGGMMPSHSLYSCFNQDLSLEKEWIVSGMEYAWTSEKWLENMDKNRKEIRAIFEKTYGKKLTSLWWGRWRVFFLSCAELWAFDSGQEWQVSHYLFRKNLSA